jgi:vacuolar-type H+-ATPase subunit I/STV1
MTEKNPTLKEILEAVHDLAGSTAAGFDRLTKEIGSVRSDLTKEIGSVRSDLTKEIGSVRSELRSFRKEVRSEFSKLWFEVDQIKHRLDKIEKNNTEEILILSGDVIELKTKVLKLEQKLAKLKLAN